jgi:hypothetical protein
LPGATESQRVSIGGEVKVLRFSSFLSQEEQEKKRRKLGKRLFLGKCLRDAKTRQRFEHRSETQGAHSIITGEKTQITDDVQ